MRRDVTLICLKGPLCTLFTGECTVQNGFTIKINDACKASSYSQLPADNNGLFAHASTMPATEDITTVIDGLANACKFDSLELSRVIIYH